MKLDTFAMERLQSTWENRVAWNVSESGVHPLRIEELADTEEARMALLAQPLAYTQTNGTPELRASIASMYPGATAEHIEVTNGGSEANLLVLLHLVQPGDRVVMMTPNYMQVHGLARGLGAIVEPWPLIDDSGSDPPRWRLDLDALESLVTAQTRAVLICNPNNPTGARLSGAEIDAICRAAARHGAWVVSDEIYRGAELDGRETETAWGRYERVLVTSGLSKAYGLPGLRIGWVVAPPDVAETLWGIHDYTSIAPGAASDLLARIALAPARRDRLIARTRGIIRTNYPLLQNWIEKRAPLLSHVAPEAGAIAFVRYRHPINSTALIERLRDEHSVLVVPGDHFGMDGYLRLGFGSDPVHLAGSLDRIGELLDRLETVGSHAG
jgi:aspartate/methionine/tyrosine aminotransferase